MADIATCVVGGQLINRSKDALDAVYEGGNAENLRIIAALDFYGAEKFQAEVKYCIEQIRYVCGDTVKLRSILFGRRTSNPFPALFTVLLIALHEALIGAQKKIADYDGVRTALTGIDARIETSRRSTTPDERRKNVNAIKGLISTSLVDSDPQAIYGAHSTIDIDSAIRRSAIETPDYELKQGILRLDRGRAVDENVFTKVIETICAIANNGPRRGGTILVGVTDKDADALRVSELDGVQPHKVGSRFVVGVKREADALGETPEVYMGRWKAKIRISSLSQPLRDDVLSGIDYNNYYGLGVLNIRIPPQRAMSLLNDRVYWRLGDETIEATAPNKIGELALRFA